MGIFWLFFLDREGSEKTSKALWIPVIWLLIGGSRNVGQWIQMSSPMDRSERYLDGNPIDRAVLGLLMLLGFIVLFKRHRQVLTILRSSGPVLLFFFYCMVSCVWSEYPDVALKRWVRGLGDLVMVLVILTEPYWIRGLKRVMTRAAILLYPLSILFIRYYPDLGRGYNNAGSTMFWTGVTTDKNGLGMICLVFGLGTVWRFLEIYEGREGDDIKKPRLAQGILVVFMLWLLYESNSMTSIMCFVLSGAIMLMIERWPLSRKPVVAAGLACGAVAISAFVLFGGAGALLELIGRNPSLTGRTEVWQALLPLAQNKLVGSGYESFWLGGRLKTMGVLTDDSINEAHNGYLEIYLNLGWVGLIVLGIVIVTGFRKVIRTISQAPMIGALMMAYFVSTLLYNFTEAAFKMMSPVWIMFLVSMMALPEAEAVEPVPVFETQRSRKFEKLEPRFGNSLRAGSSREKVKAVRTRSITARRSS